MLKYVKGWLHFSVKPWELVGFSTQYTWLLIVIFGSFLTTISSDTTFALHVKLIVLGGFLVSYLVLYLLRNRLTSTLKHARTILASGFLGSFGTCGIVFGAGAFHQLWVCGASALIFGVASAFQMIAGNYAWSKMSSQRVMGHVCISSLLAAGVFLVSLVLPAVVVEVVLVLLPLVGCIILSRTDTQKYRCSPQVTLEVFDARIIWRIRMFVMAYSFSIGLLIFPILPRLVSNHTGVEHSVLVALGAFGASLVGVLLAHKVNPSTLLNTLNKLGLPLILIGLSLGMLGERLGSILGVAALMAGFMFCDLFMWFLNAEMVAKSQKGSYEVLCISCMYEWGGMMAGTLIASLVAVEFAGYLWVFALIMNVVVVSFIFTPVVAHEIIESRTSFDAQTAIERACESLAAQYRLTSRELEVMKYLARGRSVPYIQEKLTLSQSTVKTHTHNIYIKLSVARKQELIDMVEAYAKKLSSIR